MANRYLDKIADEGKLYFTLLFDKPLARGSRDHIGVHASITYGALLSSNIL